MSNKYVRASTRNKLTAIKHPYKARERYCVERIKGIRDYRRPTRPPFDHVALILLRLPRVPVHRECYRRPEIPFMDPEFMQATVNIFRGNNHP